jgi:YD repeat-containing protein
LPLAIGTVYPFEGDWSGVTAYSFQGLIDDVRVFDRALDATEVATLASPRGHWQFGETSGAAALDSIAGNHGAYFNGAASVHAVLLDGVNDYVHAPYADNLDYRGDPFAFSARFYINPAESSGFILSKPWNSLGDYNYFLHLSADGRLNAQVYDYQMVSTPGPLSKGVWHEAVVSLDADSTMRLYVDGVLAASQPITPPVVPPPERETLFPLMIGTVYPYGSGWTGNPVYAFDGLIDDVRIYHRGVSANEAATHAADPPAGLVKSITDPLGRVMRLDYNPRGLPIKITYAAGTTDEAAVRFEYDGADRLVAEIDELGRRTQHQYDALDRLIQTTLPDPDGAGSQSAPVYAFAYDQNNRLTQETDPLGRVTSYAYSDRGELLTVTRPDHDGDGQLTVTTMSYTAREELDTITDPLGRATQYVYDALGRNTRVTLPDPDGAGPLAAPAYSSAYDRMSRLTQTLDPLTNPTDTAYANFGRTITTTQADPDGAGAQARPQTASEYDANGNLTKTTDALGAATTYAYDALNRLVKVTQPDPDGAGVQTSPVTQYQYDKAGNLRFETDPLGNITEYQYDHRDRLVKVIAADPDGPGGQAAPVTHYAYDKASNLGTVTNPAGHVTTYAYDDLGRMVSVTHPDPDGAGPLQSPVDRTYYDAAGRVTITVNALNHATYYEYDSLGHLTREIDANNQATTFTYDAAGNRLTLTDPNQNTTTWFYDGLNRMVEETNELNAARTFVYDAASNLTQKTDRNGRVTEYVYDDLHRLTSEVWKDTSTGPVVRTLNFTHDPAGRMISAADPSAAYLYAYDDLDRIKAVTHNLAGLTFNVEMQQTFDTAGNRKQRKALLGGSGDFVNDYLYDNLHRMTSVMQSGAVGAGVAEKRVDFTYNVLSQFETITRYADLAGQERVATSIYDYLCSCQLAAQEFFVSRVCLLEWITGTPEEREGGGGLGEGTGASGPSPRQRSKTCKAPAARNIRGARCATGWK